MTATILVLPRPWAGRRCADHLVCVLGVDAETQGEIDGLVELGVLWLSGGAERVRED